MWPYNLNVAASRLIRAGNDLAVVCVCLPVQHNHIHTAAQIWVLVLSLKRQLVWHSIQMFLIFWRSSWLQKSCTESLPLEWLWEICCDAQLVKSHSYSSQLESECSFTKYINCIKKWKCNEIFSQVTSFSLCLKFKSWGLERSFKCVLLESFSLKNLWCLSRCLSLCVNYRHRSTLRHKEVNYKLLCV